MAKREVIDGRLYVGDWIYDAPGTEPDAEGKTFLAGMKNAADGEFYELGLDEEGFPCERKFWKNDKPYSVMWKRLSLDAFIEKLEEFRYAVMGTALETWIATYDEAVKKASLAYARLLSGTYYGNPAIMKFVVYDMSAHAHAVPARERQRSRPPGEIHFQEDEGWNVRTRSPDRLARRLPLGRLRLQPRPPRRMVQPLLGRLPRRPLREIPRRPLLLHQTRTELKYTEGLREFLGLKE